MNKLVFFWHYYISFSRIKTHCWLQGQKILLYTSHYSHFLSKLPFLCFPGVNRVFIFRATSFTSRMEGQVEFENIFRIFWLFINYKYFHSVYTPKKQMLLSWNHAFIILNSNTIYITTLNSELQFSGRFWHVLKTWPPSKPPYH